MIKTVGVIGLGKMGMPMTRFLLKNGFQVMACDLDNSSLKKATQLGAKIAKHPSEIGSNCDLAIVVVGFDSEVMDVVSGAHGLLTKPNTKLIIAIASTVQIETMKDVEKAAKSLSSSIETLDIPICRGEPAAEKGQLLLLGGGKQEIFNTCLPAFSTFANDCHLLGPLGSGQVGKMINNMLLWACVSANHEGLKLGAKLKVDPEILRAALLKSSGNNWALETWLQPRPMPWAEKDMSIVMEEADKARLSLPLCGVVREVIKGIKIEKGLPDPRVT